jgi:hypothetical protein
VLGHGRVWKELQRKVAAPFIGQGLAPSCAGPRTEAVPSPVRTPAWAELRREVEDDGWDPPGSGCGIARQSGLALGRCWGALAQVLLGCVAKLGHKGGRIEVGNKKRVCIFFKGDQTHEFKHEFEFNQPKTMH